MKVIALNFAKNIILIENNYITIKDGRCQIMLYFMHFFFLYMMNIFLEIPQMVGTCMLTVQMGSLVTWLTSSLLSSHSWDRGVLWCSGRI